MFKNDVGMCFSGATLRLSDGVLRLSLYLREHAKHQLLFTIFPNDHQDRNTKLMVKMWLD